MQSLYQLNHSDPNTTLDGMMYMRALQYFDEIFCCIRPELLLERHHLTHNDLFNSTTPYTDPTLILPPKIQRIEILLQHLLNKLKQKQLLTNVNIPF